MKADFFGEKFRSLITCIRRTLLLLFSCVIKMPYVEKKDDIDQKGRFSALFLVFWGNLVFVAHPVRYQRIRLRLIFWVNLCFSS